MNYERLAIEPFGRQLLESGDLDPIYIMLYEAQLPPMLLRRWLFAYWCFYNAGTASWLADHCGPEFWTEMMGAARNEKPAPTGGRWPRGKERRHFRGDNAIAATAQWDHQWSGRGPEPIVDLMAGQGGSFSDLARRVQSQPQFGPWMACKVGDMVERVMQIPIDFQRSEVFMFRDPVKAAEMYWRVQNGGRWDDETLTPPAGVKAILHPVVLTLIEMFGGYRAPPAKDRPVGLQEVATILCKWKSHMRGHYPLNNDIHELRDGLHEWINVSPTAARLLPHVPEYDWKKATVI